MSISRGIDVADVHPIILAGGFGTRLKHVAPDVAKPMIRIEGRPFVEWVVRWLAKYGFRSATVSTYHRAEQFEDHFHNHPVANCAVHCVRELTPLGTGGAIGFVAKLAPRKPKAWLVLNGDSMILFDLRLLFASMEHDGAIVAREVSDAGRYGTLDVSADNQLLSFREKDSTRRGAGLINAGVYLLTDRLVSSIEPTKTLSLEYDVLPKWLSTGVRLDVLKTEGPFIDIGTEQTLASAADFIRQNIQHLS